MTIKHFLLPFFLGVTITSGISWFLLSEASDRPSAKETSQPSISHVTLKSKALEKSHLLTESYQSYKDFDSAFHSSKKMTWKASRKVYDQQNAYGIEMIKQYDLQHKIQVLQLREQLLSRINNKETMSPLNISHYQHPTNPLGFKMMLDDFNRMISHLN